MIGFNSNQVRVMLGTGSFSPAQTLNAVQAGSCTVLHDFDGDGDVDITAINEIADRIFLFRQDG